MKIALIGATGNVGTRILDELLSRGHNVTAIARHPDRIAKRDGVVAKKADATNQAELAGLLKGHDAVISAVNFSTTDAHTLVEAVRAAGIKRYLIVGGAGSLEVAPGVKLIDTPEFPEAYKAEASAGSQFLELLRGEKDLNWTFISPSALFFPGERTGKFRIGNDNLLTHDNGSSISYEDYAIAMVDELETPKHAQQRFTVGY